MRRRLDVAASLLAAPPVLFLDEPTTGLDPYGRLALWQVLSELTAQGTSGSIEAMCPHAVFHASHRSARAWLAGPGDLDAEILDQASAVEFSRLSFGVLLTGLA